MLRVPFDPAEETLSKDRCRWYLIRYETHNRPALIPLLPVAFAADAALGIVLGCCQVPPDKLYKDVSFDDLGRNGPSPEYSESIIAERTVPRTATPPPYKPGTASRRITLSPETFNRLASNTPETKRDGISSPSMQLQGHGH